MNLFTITSNGIAMKYHALDFLFYMSYQWSYAGYHGGKYFDILDGVKGFVGLAFFGALKFAPHLSNYTVAPLFQSNVMFSFNVALIVFFASFIYYYRKDRWKHVVEHYDETYRKDRWIIIIGAFIVFLAPTLVMFSWGPITQFVSHFFIRIISQ